MDKHLLKQIIERYESASFTVFRMLKAMIRERLPENVTEDQLEILRYIRDRGECTSTELADFFMVGKSSITAIIKRLADKELIKRLIDDKDRRFTYLSLTPTGDQLVREMNEKVEELLSKYMNHFENQEALQFIETFEKLADILLQEEGGRTRV